MKTPRNVSKKSNRCCQVRVQLVAMTAIIVAMPALAHCQESSQRKSSATVTKPANQSTKWSSSVETAFAKAEAQWNAAKEGTIKQIDADLRKISMNIDGSALADEVVSWNSKWQLLGGQDAFRRWLDSRFRNLLLDPNDLKLLVRRRLEQLHEKLVGIDNELFVTIRADVNKDFSRVPLPSVDLTNLERELNVAVNHAEDAARTSIGEFAASTGVSWVTGDAAASFFRGFGQKDANGNTTTDTEVAAWIFGAAVGYLLEHVISESVDVRGQLETQLESAVSTAMNRLLLVQSGSSCWVKPLEMLKEYHRTECLNAISSQLGTR